ncbi:serine--tRNA ligase [archaeon]|jgi:seryl-tRNA synthetase|nr:serine--tRNA ligase [archaeon]MBT6182962.1 serine--tRNA ligase [archaeon]MBT6606573.1 serine--tRNA ligase [archaeon]MBT7251800.1 serine--tRNA ligase [archaeon]MBT7661167.1 serine--tRNA ligase [archaeon]
MIDITLIRENPELVKENIKKKFQDKKVSLVDKVAKLDAVWRKEKKAVDDLRSKRNKISESINQLMKGKKKGEAKKLIIEAKKIPEELEKLENLAKKTKEKVDAIMVQIPQIMHPSVPQGKGEEDNVELEKIGKPNIPEFEIYNHAELAESLGGLDLDASRKTSGQGFYFLKGDIALLHSAILTYAKDFMVQKGYTHFIPPFLIRSDVVKGVMSFEEMDAMMYKIEDEDLYLIGTSEHSMIAAFFEKTLFKKELPQKLTSYSACFRKEKGAHGIEERGLYRVHQFEKQEMIVVCEPSDSYKFYEEMLNATVEFFKSLNIPVRKLECCSGDLADLKAKSCDVEAWSPRQKKYFEVGSCSNLEDAQSRRLQIKINDGKKNYFAHTLNNTVVASPRALIAIMENNQTKDGEIKIPKVLQNYMCGMKKITKKK